MVVLERARVMNALDLPEAYALRHWLEETLGARRIDVSRLFFAWMSARAASMVVCRTQWGQLQRTAFFFLAMHLNDSCGSS